MLSERKNFRLPVIVPIVLYNNPGKWTVPLNFKEILSGHEFFEEHILDFKYILINVHAFSEKELLELSNLIGSVFLLDQAQGLTEIIERLKNIILIIKKMEPDEFRLFADWAIKIIARGIPPENEEEIINIFKTARPEEVEIMVSNMERVLKKSWEEAREEGIKQGLKQGLEKGLEQGLEKAIINIARQMLADGEDIEKIVKYTGLAKDEVEKLN